METVKEIWLTLGIALIITLIPFCILFGILYSVFGILDMVSCAVVGNTMQLESKYHILAGCYVKTKQGSWIKESNYKALTQ